MPDRASRQRTRIQKGLSIAERQNQANHEGSASKCRICSAFKLPNVTGQSVAWDVGENLVHQLLPRVLYHIAALTAHSKLIKYMKIRQNQLASGSAAVKPWRVVHLPCGLFAVTKKRSKNWLHHTPIHATAAPGHVYTVPLMSRVSSGRAQKRHTSRPTEV